MLVKNIKKVKEFDAHGGTVKVKQLFDKEFDSGVLFFNESYIASGVELEPHTHKEDEEVYYILEGKGIMKIDDEERQVGPGDAILTKKGSTHNIKNVGKNVLRIVVFAAKVI